MTYYIAPHITDWQRQIIIGTLLGGSSIVKPKNGKNCYLSMRGKYVYWIEYKALELKNLASPKSILFEKKTNYFRWHSLCYSCFTEFYKMFYEKNNKKIEMNTLNELRDIGLAIWFVDIGKIQNNTISFKTNQFGRKGTETIAQYLTEIDLKTTILERKNGFRVKIDETSSERFLKVIAHRVPEFMEEKLKGN